VDHQQLILKLSHIGIHGACLDWFKNYLSDRSCVVKCGTSVSTSVSIDCGVPQGSILGPLLFIIYLSEVGQIIQRHGFDYVVYADDIQIYAHAHPNDMVSVLHRLENCVGDLNIWLRCKCLQMNPKKRYF
jgi:hypothetical protein